MHCLFLLLLGWHCPVAFSREQVWMESSTPEPSLKPLRLHNLLEGTSTLAFKGSCQGTPSQPKGTESTGRGQLRCRAKPQRNYALSAGRYSNPCPFHRFAWLDADGLLWLKLVWMEFYDHGLFLGCPFWLVFKGRELNSELKRKETTKHPAGYFSTV